MNSDTSRATGSLLLLLSLLIHVLLLLFLFIFQNTSHEGHDLSHSPDALIDQQQQQPEDPEHEVLIDLLPQGIEPNNTPTDDPGDIPVPDQFAQTDATDETPASEQEVAEEEMQGEEPTQEDQPAETQEQIIENPEIPMSDTPHDPIPQPQKQINQSPKKVIRKMVQRAPMRPSDTKMLTKIAQGFMQSMNAELGNRPSNDLTQLAHQRYMTKLWNNLKIAMNSGDNVLAVTSDIDTRATLVLTIDKSGKLLQALLRHPNKSRDILKMESMLITNAQKVGLFPPLPTSFKQDPVTFVMPIHLRAQAGVHSGYRLQIEQ